MLLPCNCYKMNKNSTFLLRNIRNTYCWSEVPTFENKYLETRDFHLLNDLFLVYKLKCCCWNFQRKQKPRWIQDLITLVRIYSSADPESPDLDYLLSLYPEYLQQPNRNTQLQILYQDMLASLMETNEFSPQVLDHISRWSYVFLLKIINNLLQDMIFVC